MSVQTPNMSLVQPTIGVDSGLIWEQSVNVDLGIIDTHNHAHGYGVQINPSGININLDLPFNGNNATLVRSINFQAQGSALSGPNDFNCLYVEVDGNLYFNDGVSDPPVQLTKAGAVNATSSGLVNGTASASFVSSVLVVIANTGIPAAVDAGTYILRYAGGYPSPAGNYIELRAPSALATGYNLTFPAVYSPSDGGIITSSAAGLLSYSFVDNSTIQLSAGILGVVSGGITSTQLANGAVTSFKLLDGAVVLSGTKVTGVLPISYGGTGETSITSGGTGGSTSPAIVSGTSSASASGSYGMAVSSVGNQIWSRVGNVVSVSGYFSANVSGASGGYFNLTLPSSMSAVVIFGVVSGSGGGVPYGAITYQSSSSARVTIAIQDPNMSTQTYCYSFQFQVL